jgi:hypothetical protein
MSFLTTDKAGERDGPHSNLLRQSLVELDAKIGEIRAAYERRGALEDTLFVFTSDHGMELQNTDQAIGVRPFLNDSQIMTNYVGNGLLYLRSLELKVEISNQEVNLQVVHHDNEVPVSGCVVQCTECIDPEAITDDNGQTQFLLHPDANTEDIVLTATANGFNPLRWVMSDQMR